MNRFLIKKLISWSDKINRKPLLLRGARQVGKTYLLKEFGAQEFSQCHYLNFEKQPELAAIFSGDLDVRRIVHEISLHLRRPIHPNADLLILDEIQECPRCLTALKYFCEDMPEFAVCAAGLLLGVMMSTESFPVGKVEFLDLGPMTFGEFLLAQNKAALFEEMEKSVSEKKISSATHALLWDALKEYYFVGGMPEIVKKYVTSDLSGIALHDSIRTGQQDLIDAYYKDFAKHAGAVNAMHIAGVFENVPRQLAANLDDSVKRYRFKDVLPNKRSYTELSGPIDWLTRAGLIIKTKIIEHVNTPLEAFCQNNLFKLYVFDVGLLGCMLGLDAASLLNNDYGIIKGYFSENFVATQLVAAGLSPLYAWNQANSEIEFLVPHAAQIFPLEVKSGMRTRAKSLAQYLHRYKPPKALMLTAKPMKIRDDGVVQNVALYQAEFLKKIF